MVFEKVAAILAEYKDMEASEIKMETSFEELALDSLDTVELIMKFEDEFEIEIVLEESIKTVGTVVTVIEEKLAAK